MSRTLDGTKLKNKILKELRKEIVTLNQKGVYPKLVAVQVGGDKASNIYIKNKQKTCAEIGINSDKIVLPEDISFKAFASQIKKLNDNKGITGILIQFPLPQQLPEDKVVELVNPAKDVDGLHPYNQGKNIFRSDKATPKPCTPGGIMNLLGEHNVQIEGKHVVVIGRSKIVGMPLNFLLTQANATVSHLNSKTNKQTFRYLLKNADIVVSATGQKDLFSPLDVKKGVVIIDVGIIRDNEKIRGDVCFDKFKEVASYISPVPGGVGPMTIATLMQNVVLLAKTNS